MDTLIPDAELADILRLASDIVSDVAGLYRKRGHIDRTELFAELLMIRKTADLLRERASIAQQNVASSTMAGA